MTVLHTFYCIDIIRNRETYIVSTVNYELLKC